VGAKDNSAADRKDGLRFKTATKGALEDPGYTTSKVSTQAETGTSEWHTKPSTSHMADNCPKYGSREH